MTPPVVKSSPSNAARIATEIAESRGLTRIDRRDSTAPAARYVNRSSRKLSGATVPTCRHRFPGGLSARARQVSCR